MTPFAIEQADGRMFYGIPAVAADGVKFGEHTGGKIVRLPYTPEKDDGAAETAALSFLQDFAPGFSKTFTRRQSCFYEMSADGHMIIDTHPDAPNVHFAFGLSGHGFKFAPLIGDALSALAMGEELPKEFDFLRAKRFGA